MNNIDSLNTRNKFFPSGKEPNISKTQQPNPALKRNEIDRQKELKTKTVNDAKVDISDAVRDFSRIKSAVDNAPEIDNSEKIASLKSQIQNGHYEIDYDGLADKILSSEF